MKLNLNGNLSTNFTVAEAFKNQTDVDISVDIIRNILNHAKRLQKMRAYLGKSMPVNGWYRSAKYNASVGGISTSLHLKGLATDVSYSVSSEDEYKKLAKKWCSICGNDNVRAEIIWYKTSGFIHFGSGFTGSSHYIGINENGKLRRV